MGGESVNGIQGWLSVYIVASIPVLLFFSAGLAGWFFDYPIGLWLAIFLVLASPLVKGGAKLDHRGGGKLDH